MPDSKTKMKKIKIKRYRWLRGEGNATSLLYRATDKKMCCLGFACRAFRLKVEDISGVATPPNIYYEKQTMLPEWLRPENCYCPSEHPDDSYCNLDLYQAMRINDDCTLPEPEREERLKEIFLRNDIELEFVD